MYDKTETANGRRQSELGYVGTRRRGAGNASVDKPDPSRNSRPEADADVDAESFADEEVGGDSVFVTETVDSTPGPARVSGRAEAHRIGEIMVDQGAMSRQEADHILALQQTRAGKGKRFGRLARKMNYVERNDVQRALKTQSPSFPQRRNRGVDHYQEPISRELCCLSDKPNATAEAIRGLRSQLLIRAKKQSNGKRKAGSVAIMSPDRREGRSFIAANLAVAFAQAGRRTLLVDADLRSPRQHEIFKAENSAGFCSLLEGIDAGRPVYTALENLYLVPAGIGRSNPQDLLCRDEAGHWLDVAHEYFDMVVLDTPAANEFADAEIIASWASQVVVVIRKGVTRSSAVNHLGDRMASNDLPITGYVVNA